MRRPLPRNPRVQTPRTSSRRKNLLPQLPQVCLRHIVMRGMWFRNECAHSLAAQFKLARLLHFLSLCFPYHVSSNRSLWCALTRSCQSLHIENAVANTVERKISKAKIEELATPKRRSTQVRNGNGQLHHCICGRWRGPLCSRVGLAVGSRGGARGLSILVLVYRGVEMISVRFCLLRSGNCHCHLREFN